MKLSEPDGDMEVSKTQIFSGDLQVLELKAEAGVRGRGGCRGGGGKEEWTGGSLQVKGTSGFGSHHHSISRVKCKA